MYIQNKTDHVLEDTNWYGDRSYRVASQTKIKTLGKAEAKLLEQLQDEVDLGSYCSKALICAPFVRCWSKPKRIALIKLIAKGYFKVEHRSNRDYDTYVLVRTEQ